MPAYAKFNMKIFTHLITASKYRNTPWVCNSFIVKYYAKSCDKDHNYKTGCRRALTDIPPKDDPICPEPCDRHAPKKSKILHKLKLKILEGGTNFGTPFRKVKCDKTEEKTKQIMKIKRKSPGKIKSLSEPTHSKVVVKAPATDSRPGVQVSILGVETPVGQYLSLLLKQCPTIKKLRLYEATLSEGHNVCKIAHDLNQINTNCGVQAFSSNPGQLERCLQNTDIVVMLENGSLNINMSIENRFLHQAPTVKAYADAIATECPRAFLVVCASPIDCMVPFIAEILKETGWYDPRKLLGSMAVPEMRASTLAARALGLEPRYTRVPCIGGTEGDALVPLFSKAIENFDFTPHNAAMMTEAIRLSAADGSKMEGGRSADLGEAHALAKLVTNISHALLCNDKPRISGYVESDGSQIISPARYIANEVELGRIGITKNFGIPKVNDFELNLMINSLIEINNRVSIFQEWYNKSRSSVAILDTKQLQFFDKATYQRIEDCAYANI